MYKGRSLFPINFSQRFKSWEIWQISSLAPIIPPVPPSDLAIAPQQKLYFRNDEDICYHFKEFCFFSFKTVVLQAFENWLNLGKITSKDLLMFFLNNYMAI